jgi:hypothetical protein
VSAKNNAHGTSKAQRQNVDGQITDRQIVDFRIVTIKM